MINGCPIPCTKSGKDTSIIQIAVDRALYRHNLINYVCIKVGLTSCCFNVCLEIYDKFQGIP